ncbi:DUF6783 domain-containing protein [Anaerobutyricum hallii]|uniref:DUF6783 domain-containing protein n=1 Tax=Anaerobutyricum hallii TaxID=39488 RepID=UPI002FE599AA
MYVLPYFCICAVIAFSIFYFSSMFFPRACLKKAFCKMCGAICGRFRLNEGGVAGYVN